MNVLACGVRAFPAAPSRPEAPLRPRSVRAHGYGGNSSGGGGSSWNAVEAVSSTGPAQRATPGRGHRREPGTRAGKNPRPLVPGDRFERGAARSARDGPRFPVAGRDSDRNPPHASLSAQGGGRGGGADYLYELGRSQGYNINVDHGQSSTYIDNLFAGNVLGHRSDIADGSLRQEEFRTFNNIVGDYYVSPRYMERVALHLCKNALASQLAVNVPLIMGIWGGKGQGKSFQLELACKKMGVEPIIMSAGELEHEWAGMPGKLIMERYAKAAQVCKNQGKMSALIINDIDAGIGRFQHTQVTVNNQIVFGTLMSLCDNPAFVPSGGLSWDEMMAQNVKRANRIPIIVTGNDLSTVFAPLTRDGRMDKFFWQVTRGPARPLAPVLPRSSPGAAQPPLAPPPTPTSPPPSPRLTRAPQPNREEMLMSTWGMFKDDGLTRGEMEALLDAFPNQTMDFFGSMRQATYDGEVRKWILEMANRTRSRGHPITTCAEGREEDFRFLTEQLIHKVSYVQNGKFSWDPEDRSTSKMLEREFDADAFRPPEITLDKLLAEGRRLVQEQDNVNEVRLAEEYVNKFHSKVKGPSLVGFGG